jgi:hypothetical protein
MKTWLLAYVLIILTISMIMLSNINNTLLKMYEERNFKITEIVNIDKTTWDIQSFGVIVLPDDDFNTKGYDEAVYPRGE